MEFFKTGLKSVLGSQPSGVQQNDAETVKRLVDRVATSTLLEDRRDACRALKALSKKYRVEIGTQGMQALRQVLENDRSDCEIISYCLDTLCNITSTETFDEERETNEQLSNLKIGEQFSEMFIKHSESVTAVLSFLEEYDFRVRRSAVKLLTSLLDSKPREIQQIVLDSKLGISKLMDLLSDGREIIRNDALLLLLQLTKGNANIQKIVAFENAFDRLFDVISKEGGPDGDIVVEDCLLLMMNLLKNNSSNQNFFKEGSYIQKLAPMLILPPDIEDEGWSPQKVSNVHCLLQVVRTLIMPGNPQQVVSSCQEIMRSCKLLETLCSLLMTGGVPADILTETINTVGEIIRGNINNQNYFANVMAPSTPPQPSLVILLRSMINETQNFALRCAVFYCFACFLHKNEIGQTQVVQSLLPSNNSGTLSMGQLLCSGLFSADSLSSWFSAVALSYALVDNSAQKENMLNVLLTTNLGTNPITFLQQCTSLLQEGSKIQTKIGLMMLLSTWLAHCPLAVKAFLNIPGSMAFLTAQTSANEHDDTEELLQGLCSFLMGICVCFNDDSVHAFTIEALTQLIEKRVGLETYITKLSDVSKHEMYSKAAKYTQYKAKSSNDLLLDYEFCRLFKSLEPVIIKTVTRGLNVHPDSNGMTELCLSSQENGLLLQYKELIRDQDRRLNELTTMFNGLMAEKNDLQQKLDEALSRNSELVDQNTLLRAQISNDMHLGAEDTAAEMSSDQLTKVLQEKEMLEQELEALRRDQDGLFELTSDQEEKLKKYKKRLRELNVSDISDDDDEVNLLDSDDD